MWEAKLLTRSSHPASSSHLRAPWFAAPATARDQISTPYEKREKKTPPPETLRPPCRNHLLRHDEQTRWLRPQPLPPPPQHTAQDPCSTTSVSRNTYIKCYRLSLKQWNETFHWESQFHFSVQADVAILETVKWISPLRLDLAFILWLQ
jgi:hypothetical protein